VITISKYTTLEDINSILKSASKTQFKGIISYIQEPLVSVDMIGVSESSIIDSLSTKVIKGNFIKILAWYDNEWGFASRVVDLISFLSKKL
jgi:glyceraldehyde 3-phosphate dehydrogenase